MVDAVFCRAELLGMSGAGKSTVIHGLAHAMPNLRSSLPYWRRPVLLAWCVLVQLVVRAPRNRIGLAVFKNIAQLRWFIFAHKKLGKSDGLGATNYVLDQGPAFQLAIGLVEGAIKPGSPLYRAAIRAINNWAVDGLIWLDVPHEVLEQRLASRSGRPTRSMSLTSKERTQLAARYRQAYERIRSDTTNVVHIHADREANKILNEVIANMRGLGG